MSDFNLDSFLAAQGAEGQSDGIGDFTISHSKAVQKMTQFSLPREESWVLKLVQAAVQWGCSEITLRQTRTTSTFHFEFPDLSRLPNNDQLVGALLRANFESPKATEKFGTGLRILVERSYLSFLLLSHPGGDGETPAIFAGVYFGDMSEEERREFRSSWGPGLTVAVNHIAHTEQNRLLLNYVPIRDFALPVQQELERHGYAAPVTMTCDGRRFDGPLRSSALGWGRVRKPVWIGRLTLPDATSGKMNTLGSFPEARFLLTSPHQEVLGSLESGETTCALFMAVAQASHIPGQRLGFRPRSRLNWVHEGVVVQDEVIGCSTRLVSLEVFADATGLKTDLTGFQLVDSPELRTRRIQVLDALSDRLLEEIARDRNLFPAEAETEELPEADWPRPKFRPGYSGSFLRRLLLTAGEGVKGLASDVVQNIQGATREHWGLKDDPDVYTRELELLREHFREAEIAEVRVLNETKTLEVIESLDDVEFTV